MGIPIACRPKEAQKGCQILQVPDSCEQSHIGARNQAPVLQKNRKCS